MNPTCPSIPPPTRHAVRRPKLGVAALTAFALLAGCRSLPSDSALLEKTRHDYYTAEEDPRVRELAKAELRQADRAVREADKAWAHHKAAPEVEALAAVAKQRVVAAQETTASKRAGSATVDEGTAHCAAHAARPIEAGRVTAIRIDDVLFATGASRIDAAGSTLVGTVVGVLNRDPKRKVTLEGFTDRTGREAANEALSGRRAEAVRAALIDRGIAAERVVARGRGAAFPVGGNDSARGRRSNRRVEIVVSDDEGDIAVR